MTPETPAEVVPDQGPVEDLPAYGADGTDLTLIRWMLSKTPGERLDILQGSVRSLTRLRDALRNNGLLGAS